MDVCKAVSAYVARMVKEVQGMKILLLDDHTVRKPSCSLQTPIMSAAYTQSALLEHEVFLTDKIQNGVRERMQHLQCVVFVSPCHVSFHALVEELRQPLYGSYWLYFSNAVPKHAIEQLAEADQHQVVQSVQEYFADYVPVTPSLFSLNYPAPPMPIWGTSASQWDAEAFQRHSSGLMAVLLSLKKKPVVRYERMSALALKLAKDMVYKMNEAHAPLFDFRRTDIPPLLLILDRRNDPVTPLLSQWTYQAMVHELIGIHNGRTQVPGKQGELEETVLSVDRDPFFAANLYDNFGDLGASIKEYVTKFQTRSSSTSSIDTIQDMKRFVEEYPEFQRLRGNVSKHVALLGELSKIVELRHLLKVSELEQSLASTESHTTDLRALQEMLASEQIVNEAKLRLAILYALRYQKWSGNQIDAVARQLMQVGLEESQVVLLYVMLNFAGAEQRQDDLFANENIFSRGKSALKGLKGVENVYTQHSPHILETVENLMRGRLRTSSYPFAATEPSGPDAAMPSTLAPNGPLTKPQDVILFIIGGTTYEEARAIALLNGAQPGAPSQQPFPGTHFLLGGSTIHNSHSFLHMIETTAARMPNSITRPPPSAGGNGMHLRLGPVQLGMEDREALHDGINGAREFASDLFGRFKRGVENNL